MQLNKKCVYCAIVLFLSVNIVSCEEFEDAVNEFMDSLSNSTDVFEGRTFGHHFLKRISFAILPAAFVIGVITTLLAALTVVSLKSLGVGVILLVLAVGQLLARTFSAPIAPLAYHQPHTVPIVYQRSGVDSVNPLWLDKDWS